MTSFGNKQSNILVKHCVKERAQMNNVEKLNGYCSGCGCCELICKFDAVKVELDADGFFSARVDEQKCVECGQCISVCLRGGVKNAVRLTEGRMIAAQSKNKDVVKSCTSGGIAYELSQKAIADGDAVVGVIYDYEKDMAKTVLGHNEEEIEEFKGSKYLQSYTAEGFRAAIEEAEQNPNRKILVFGMPCQIYGFASLIEKKGIRDQFILVDLFCHGVPSYLLWNKYLQKIKRRIGEDKLTKVIFRDKCNGWHNFVMRIHGKTGEYKKNSEGDLFYNAFFDNVLLCKSCFDCPVRQEFSKADIRLGDYWGKRFQDREDGVSAVLILNEKGERVLKYNKNVLIIETTTVQEMVRVQSVQKYDGIELQREALKSLSVGSIGTAMKSYREHFEPRKRLKLKCKRIVSIFPEKIRNLIKNHYRRKKV